MQFRDMGNTRGRWLGQWSDTYLTESPDLGAQFLFFSLDSLQMRRQSHHHLKTRTHNTWIMDTERGSEGHSAGQMGDAITSRWCWAVQEIKYHTIKLSALYVINQRSILVLPPRVNKNYKILNKLLPTDKTRIRCANWIASLWWHIPTRVSN